MCRSWSGNRGDATDFSAGRRRWKRSESTNACRDEARGRAVEQSRWAVRQELYENLCFRLPTGNRPQSRCTCRFDFRRLYKMSPTPSPSLGVLWEREAHRPPTSRCASSPTLPKYSDSPPTLPKNFARGTAAQSYAMKLNTAAGARAPPLFTGWLWGEVPGVERGASLGTAGA